MKLLTWPKPKGLLEEGAALTVIEPMITVIDVFGPELWMRCAMSGEMVTVIDYMTREEFEKQYPSARITVRADDDFWREP